MLLGPGDDLGVEGGQLLGEGEVGLAERVGPGAVVQVQHAEHPALVDQRDAEGALDVEALPHDPEVLAIRLAAQPQGARLGGDLAGDALAQRHPDLAPELRLETRGDPHPQLAARLVQQHQ